MKHYLVLVVCAVAFVAACGAPPTATPDAVATQVAVGKAAAATLTAEAPTATRIPTKAITSTSTVSPTETATATTAPTRTQEATRTLVPTPEPMPTSAPTSTEHLIDMTRLELFVASLFEDLEGVTTSGTEVQVAVNSSGVSYFGEVYHGVELVEDAEIHAYVATYNVFKDFPEVEAVITEVRYNGEPAYRAGARREAAYAFRPGTFGSGSPQSQSPDTLTMTAIEQFVINGWDTQYLIPELGRAVSDPSEYDIKAVVEHWVSGEVLAAGTDGDELYATIDLTELADMFYDAYGKDDPFANEEVHFEACLATVNSMYALFLRFPGPQTVAIEIQIHGSAYSAHQCTRRRFFELGPDTFLLGGLEGDPAAVLELLSSP